MSNQGPDQGHEANRQQRSRNDGGNASSRPTQGGHASAGAAGSSSTHATGPHAAAGPLSANPASTSGPGGAIPSESSSAVSAGAAAVHQVVSASQASTSHSNSSHSKSTSLQNYHLLAFRKALHPEFFGIEGRQRVQHGDYETEAWIFRGGHSLRFQLNGFCMSEVVVEQIDQIPDRGLVTALPCAGERDFEEKVAENIVYMTTMQTETLSDHLYLGTYKEMMQHARDNDSLFVAWTDQAGRPNLSLVDVQHFRNEAHLQGYHLRSDCGLVLRTQSMIQIVAPKKSTDKKAAEKKPSDKKSFERPADRNAKPGARTSASARSGRESRSR